MGKPKRSREEILEQQKLRQQRRREKIKNDPALYAAYKEKDRLRYYKKKDEGKILPINQETPTRKNERRKRNRRNFKAYYKRQKAVKLLETIEEVSFNTTEPKSLNEIPIETNDPLALSPAPNKPKRSPRPKYSLRSVQNKSELFRSSSANSQKLLISSSEADSEKQPQASCSNTSRPLKQKSVLELSRSKISTPIQGLIGLQEDSDNLSSIYSSPSSQHTLHKISSESSIATSCSESTIVVPKRKIRSPNSNVAIRRLRYKSKKQLDVLNSKIHKLKTLNEKYRKKIYRLEKKANQKDVNKENENINHIPINKVNVITEERIKNVKDDVENFLEEDENSRICPGKKEYITKSKIKKQKRFLTDSLQNLHIKFINSVSYKISYSTFCKMRPFWILVPDVKARETCMCKIHSNMDLMVTALNRFSLINESSTHKILCSICCDPMNEECLTRRCKKCVNKTVVFKEFDNSKEIYYLHWISKKQTYLKDGNERVSNKIIKEKIVASPKIVINTFQNMLPPFLIHCTNVTTQHRFIKRLKANLKDDETIVHVDYSENYNTKYAIEIQSFHFAGSRRQITLHTVVIYYKKDTKLVTQSFCTVSESLRHDVVAVWEHLIPILKHIQTEVPHVRVIHFISDSPTGQYRNKKMFYVISELHRDYPTLKFVSWNYTESGHGKGAPDGVGAVVKRTADRLVAQGNDIVDIQSLMNHLKTNIRGILLEVVNESDILQKDLLFPLKMREFKGTMKVHQVIWSCEKPNTLAMRRLSCDLNDCLGQLVQCTHRQHIGFYEITDEKENINIPQPSTSSNIQIANLMPSRNSSKPKILSNILIQSADRKHSEKYFKTLRKPVYVQKTVPSSSDCELELPSNDSFWAPVSPVDFSITGQSSAINKSYESDDSDDLRIF